MSPAEKKKPGLALILSMGKSKGHDSDDDDDDHAVDDGLEDDDGESYAAARDELADIIGVKERDREAFGDALKAFVVTCK